MADFNLVPGLTLPIVDSNRLNAGLASARAQSNVMIAQCNQSVLNAVGEVAQVDKVTVMEARLSDLFEQIKEFELRNRQINSEIALTMALGAGTTCYGLTQHLSQFSDG